MFSRYEILSLLYNSLVGGLISLIDEVISKCLKIPQLIIYRYLDIYIFF